jgi:hypothetical protein
MPRDLPPSIHSFYGLLKKASFLGLLKNGQMQGAPAFAEAASRRQAKF